jgi:hypothetical protein
MQIHFLAKLQISITQQIREMAQLGQSQQRSISNILLVIADGSILISQVQVVARVILEKILKAAPVSACAYS